MSDRIDFMYYVEIRDRVYLSSRAKLKPLKMEIGARMFWALRCFTPEIKVLSISLPAVAPLKGQDRAKAHYKLLRHHYKKSKKQERIDKWRMKVQMAQWQRLVRQEMEDTESA